MKKQACRKLGYCRQLFIIAAMLCVCIGTYAQGITVTGVIVDDTNFPLPGVNVTVKETSAGTISDMDGKFSIQVPNERAVLRFTYIGFNPVEYPLNGKDNITVTLTESTQNLDEVVVVGYGVQKKSHLTGSISKVDMSGLEDIPVSRVDQALQGRIAGVQIQNTTSEVGEAPTIRVRGMGSISANSEPLVIIDGFPVEGGLGVVNPNDIESIEVLKDAASAAIYGSRAANGVIMITTKSGEIKKPKYTVKASYGTKHAYKLHPIMSSQEYVQMRARESQLLGVALPAQDFAFGTMSNNTDWQREGLRNAQIYNINFSVSGGTNEVKYYVSGAMVNDQGIMLDSEYKRFNVRAKIDAKLSERIKMGINLSPSYTDKQKPSSNFIDFYRTPSWLPVRHTEETAAITGAEAGSYASGAQFNNKTYTGIDPITGEERTVEVSPFNTRNHNPAKVLDTDKRYTDEYRLNTSAYLTIELMKGLEFKTSDGFNIRYLQNDGYRERDSKENGVVNRGYYNNNMKIDLLSENTLNYLKKVGDHDFNAMIGFSAQKTNISRAGIVGVDFPTDLINTINAAGTITLTENNGRVTGTWKEEEALLSYYARLIYSYQDKYLLSASWRTDGSSKFGDNNRWAQFPSVSLGWRISEESFMSNMDWLDQLKLRGSYGITGNDDIPNYAKMDLLGAADYSLGAGNGDKILGLANNFSTLGNASLQWEQTNEYNVGFDLSIFRRVSLNLEYYYSITKSMLYKRPISSITGYQDQWTNLGKVRNRGIELEINSTNIQKKNFSWNTSFNISSNSNMVLDLGGPESIITQGSDANEMYIAQVGKPAIQYYGFKTVGVWNNQQEIDDNPHHNSDQPGGLRVLNAVDDGRIDDNDRVALGDPFPDFTWGLTNSFKIYDFDFSFLIQGVQGVDVYNGDARYNESRKWNSNYVDGRWLSAEHPGDGKTPYFTNGLNWMLTDHVIEDGSYIALRDITLGYTLPSKYCKKIGLRNLRAYASAQNVAFWWPKSYRGVNPEARYTNDNYGSSPLIDGYQRGGFPIQRTISVGLELTF